MPLESAAALVAVIVAVASAAYSFGVLATRIQDQSEEIKRVRDRLDKFMDYWKIQ